MPISRIENAPMNIEAESKGQTGRIIQKKLFDQPFPDLEQGVDYRVRRNSLISSNIANLNTPNYRAFDLVMNEKLRDPQLVPTSTPVKNDGNTVDLDLEMSKLTENQLMFTTLTLMLSKRFEQLRTVIAEGRK
ncbi:MAG: flagellar basal body protein [bacterium]